jgi:hypothetical protein
MRLAFSSLAIGRTLRFKKHGEWEQIRSVFVVFLASREV